MKNTLPSFLLAWALAIGVGNPAHWEDNHSQTIDEKREVIITSVNNLIQQKWITLKPGEKCVITVFGKQKELQAILACNGTKKWTHTSNLEKWENYLTQIFDIESTNAGLLNPNQWCIIIEAWWETRHWKQCEDTQEKPDKMKKPSNWRNFWA